MSSGKIGGVALQQQHVLIISHIGGVALQHGKHPTATGLEIILEKKYFMDDNFV